MNTNTTIEPTETVTLTRPAFAVNIGDTTPGSDPYHRQMPRLAGSKLKIDPERRAAWTEDDYDDGATPALEYHGRVLVLDCEDGNGVIDGEPLEKFLTGDAGQSMLCRITDGYETRWDGHNHVGHTDADADEAMAELQAAILELPATKYALADPQEWYGDVIGAATTDEEIAEMAASSDSEEYEEGKIVWMRDVLEALTELRDVRREKAGDA